MYKQQLVLKKIAVASTIGALAIVSALPVKADPILGQFTISPGTLNSKIIGLGVFNTAYNAGTPSYAYADFGSYGNTVPSAINLKTDSVSPSNPSNQGVEGTTDPLASTTNQNVHGVFTAAFLNGSGSSFNSTLSFTNFAKANASGVVIIPEVVLPIYAGSTSYASLQAKDAVNSNITGYTGQIATSGVGSQLTSAQSVTSVTNPTSTGDSNTFTLLDYNTGNGLGEIYKNTGLNFTIPAYSQTGKYVSTLTFTTTVE